MLGEVVDDDEEEKSDNMNTNSPSNNEVLIKNIKCELCKKIPISICTCDSCNKYYCKKCTENLEICLKCGKKAPSFKENGYLKRILELGNKIVECEFCHDYFLEKDLFDHNCKVPHYICKCCKKYSTIDKKEFWDHLITNHKEEFVKEIDLNN